MAALLNALADQVAAKVAERLPQVQATGAPANRLFSVGEGAKYLGRSKRAVEALIHDRRLPVVRIDRRVFLDRFDLDRFIDSHKEG